VFLLDVGVSTHFG